MMKHWHQFLKKNDHEDPEELINTMKRRSYGMYFLRYERVTFLRQRRQTLDMEQKYFLDGFWNAKAKGWFFKREMKRFLKDHGAKYIKLKA